MLYKLESLRGVAACLVVLFHSPFNVNGTPSNFIANSYLFVDFFFILSGYVMTLAYASRISEGLPFKKYVVLRLGRIYPLHLVMLLAWVPYVLMRQYLFESGLGGHNQFVKNNLTTFISNIFLLNSMGLHEHMSWNFPAWSISTEFYAYIAFYWITTLLDKKHTLYIPIIASAVCYGFLFSLGRDDMDFTYDFGFFRCLGAFYLGVFILRISHKLPSPTQAGMVAALEGICAALIVFFVWHAESHLAYSAAAIAAFALTIYIFSLKESGLLGYILQTNAFRKIGLWSYSIYLVHALIVGGISNVLEYILGFSPNKVSGFEAVLVNVLMLATVIFISRFTYVFIEDFFRVKSRNWAKKMD